MKTLTFDELPRAVSQLGEEIREIKSMLAQRLEPQSAPTQDQILNVKGAAAFLELSVPTVRSKTSRGELPSMKKGNRVYYSLVELMEYLKTGKRKSNSEIEAEADVYLSAKKKGTAL